MRTLTCILDDCPKVAKSVDWRRCAKCSLYVEAPGFGTVQCFHANARHTRKNRKTWAAMKAAAGVMHVRLTGPMIGE